MSKARQRTTAGTPETATRGAVRRLRSAGQAARIVATATAVTALLGAPSAAAWATAGGTPTEAEQPPATGDQGTPLPLVLS